MIYPHDPTKTPQANSIAPSANEFELDADVKAKFLLSCCWVPLAAWQLSPQFRFILLVMSDESSGSIGVGDAATITEIEKRTTQRDRMRRLADMLDGYKMY